MITYRVFAGAQPAIADRLLEPPHATKAENCLLDNGNLRALNEAAPVAEQPVLASGAETLFLYGVSWFSFSSRVNAVRSPIKQDDYDRVYITGLDVPRYTRNDIATAGNGGYPSNTYKLGVPAPESAPLVEYSPDGEDPDPLDNETRFYVVTFVTSTGEESKPSPASEEVTIEKPGTDVVTLALPGVPVNESDIVSKRIYRTGTGGAEAGFFALADVALSADTFTDDPADYVVGPSLVTRGFDMPPEDMHSLIGIKGGMLIGASGQTICPSEAYLPYAYKKANQIVVNAPVVAMAPLPTGAVVATEAYPEIITGYSPDTLANDRLELDQACVSARSMVDMGQYVIYAAPDGLVMASMQGAQLITEGVWLREQWQALKPETINAYHHDGQYIGFFDTGSLRAGFVFDPNRKDITFLNFYASAGYRDLSGDALYLVINDQLCKYRSGNKLAYIWRSKVAIKAAQAYPLYRVKHAAGADITQTTVRIITEDGVIVEDVLTDEDWGYLPPGLYERWQIEVESTEVIEALMLGETLMELSA